MWWMVGTTYLILEQQRTVAISLVVDYGYSMTIWRHHHMFSHGDYTLGFSMLLFIFNFASFHEDFQKIGNHYLWHHCEPVYLCRFLR